MSDTTTAPASDAAKSAELPAPAAETPDSAAVKSVTTDAAKAADGTSENQTPDLEKKEPTPGELARKERNKQRWQAMKSERQQALQEAARLRAENERLLRSTPDYSQIQDPDEALAARTAHKVREMTASDRDVDIQRHQAQAEAALFSAWDAIKEEARAAMPDFDAVVNERTPIHPRMAPVLVESEMAGELAYYLGKNPQEANSLAHMFETNPARALVEFGRLEAKVSKPAAKAVSQAPKPAPSLNGSAAPPAFDPAGSSVADMRAHLKRMGVI